MNNTTETQELKNTIQELKDENQALQDNMDWLQAEMQRTMIQKYRIQKHLLYYKTAIITLVCGGAIYIIATI